MRDKNRIIKVFAREILDSRGNPTVEAEVTAGKIVGRAAAPSGASKSGFEAAELRDGGKRFLGLGVQKAVDNVNKIISKKLVGKDVRGQKEIDDLMVRIDGTRNKSKLGANAILAVSLACARTAALAEHIPLYSYISKFSGNRARMPTPFMNVINGGKHALNNLVFQEFMIVPKLATFKESLRAASETYHVLKGVIEKKFKSSGVGDEGGFSPPIRTPEEALNLLEEAVDKAGYRNKIRLAVDAAASEFYDERKYFPKKGLFFKKYSTEEMMEYYIELIKSYRLLSLEDPFDEEDFESFAELTKKSKIQIVGDDLLATNLERIKRAIKLGSCNCLLLKPNQVGTLTEAIKAANTALKNNWAVMVSNRSGETEDSFIADLAVGLGCGQIKAGAPCRGERTAKYNQQLRISERVRK
jgi:enolase